MPRYRPVEPKVDLPAMERRILERWDAEGTFGASIARRAGSPRWVFYDGPPTANNKPHIGHVEARTFKDVFPRYRTMTGHLVDRKAGWDCHGLPVEVEVEKRIGTRSKRDIERFGVEKFIRLCRESVQEYVADWKRVSRRMGFWIDMEDAYWTMDASYVQSVWWAVKRLHELDLLYQDFRVTAYCPRCGTGLSDAEVALGYTTIEDPSVYLEFPVTDGPDGLRGASLVGWTTTPWTLISNLGLAVDEAAEYVRVSTSRGDLVVAEARLPLLGELLGGDDLPQAGRMRGAELVGARYEPPYPNVDGSTHRVVAAGFVQLDEGTGVVHMAPAFGTEDLEVGRREGWPLFNPVDEEGRFTDLAPEFVRGRFVKEADADIIDDLRARRRLVAAQRIEHTYPLCWRCDTPLLYYPRRSWYIRTTARKDELLAANDAVHWYPPHIQQGRYGDWLRNNVDWSLSRERYWGTPLPIWRCGAEHLTVVGSLAELSEVAGRDVTGLDPHRPGIDEVVVACRECGAEARRVPEVGDAWFDSGAMPFAQWGYQGPGSPGGDRFLEQFPADFIAEGLDQTRGWFYSLMAEGVLLFGQSAYRNVICHGLVMDAEGRKMSKRLGNVIEPEAAFEQVGADAVRWFMLASGSPWSDRRASFEMMEDVVRRFVLTLWNTYAFYVTYANLDDLDLSSAPPPEGRPVLDRWALSRLHGTVAAVRTAMDAYDATAAARRIEELVDDLSNWYVRRSRRRFWEAARAGGDAEGKLAAHATLEEALRTLAGLLAPLTPFVAEELYVNLVAEVDPQAARSVHLIDYPEPRPDLVDPELDAAMEDARRVVGLGRTVRTDAKVRVRQPLARATVSLPGGEGRLQPLLGLVADELNVASVGFAEGDEALSEWRARPNFRSLGPRLGPRAQAAAEAIRADDGTLARDLASGRWVVVSVEGEDVTIEPGDVELAQQTRPGWAMATDGAFTVALDLEVDDALRAEGAIREVVHHVQALRRSAGLDLTDRIVLGVDAVEGGLVARALDQAGDRVATEVLAVEIRPGPVEDPSGVADAEVEGERVRFSLRRA
jgi:isoleucyl-tRNA synthetase